MKFFINIFYSILYFSEALYKADPRLDILLIYLKEVGIKSISEDNSNFTIIFNDDTALTSWKLENRQYRKHLMYHQLRWFSFMSSGVINFSNGKRLNWNERMPSGEVRYKFKRVILKYENEEKRKADLLKKNIEIESFNYEEYLPTKISRRLKLKKLKK